MQESKISPTPKHKPTPNQGASVTENPPISPAEEATAASQPADVTETKPSGSADQPPPDHQPPPPDLAQALRKAEQQAQENHDAWLRAKAETENVRRRSQEEITKASKFAAEKFASAMLPVKDSLEAALNSENQTLESLREGVELTLRQLESAFSSTNLREENPLGQKFDPNLHQAIGTLESEAEPNSVVSVLQKGYCLHDRVIRPAMVMVAQAKAS